MKKLFCMLALVLGCSAAHAQVYFEPGSARPINPDAATHQLTRAPRAHAPKAIRLPVRCRNRSRHARRGCGRHGMVRR